MDIKQLIENVKKKINDKVLCEDLIIEDKTNFHIKHKSHNIGKYHLRITIKSTYLEKKNKIDKTRMIYKILDYELKNYIHSLILNFH